MERGKNQRLKLLYLLDILMEKTDDDHGLTINEIIKELEARDVSAERKALYTDFLALEDYGVDIYKYQEGKNWYYKICSRDFELAELKLLVDSVQCAKFITAKKTNELIKKLEKLASSHEAKHLQRQVFVSERNKTINEKIYLNVDRIHTAINTNKRIEFHYFQWNTKKEMVLKHDGALYDISPWGLSWDDENYYMIGYDANSNSIRHYRIDKMLDINVSESPRLGRELYDKIDLANYSKSVFGMFAGDEMNVRLECKNSMAGVIIDRFGSDIMILPKDSENFIVNVNVVPSTQFFGWVFSLGNGVKVIGPTLVVEQISTYIDTIYSQYH